MYDNFKQRYVIKKIIDNNKPDALPKTADKQGEPHIGKLKIFNVRKKSLENLELRGKERSSEEFKVKLGMTKQYSCSNLKNEMMRRQSKSILSENTVFKRKKDIYHEEIINKAILLKECKEKISLKFKEKNTVFSKSNLYLTSFAQNDQNQNNVCFRLPLIEKIKGVITQRYSREKEEDEELNKRIDIRKSESDKMKRLVEERMRRIEGHSTDKKFGGSSFTEYSYFSNVESKHDNNNNGMFFNYNESDSIIRKAPLLASQRFFVSEVSNKNHEIVSNNLIEKEKKKFRINFKINIEKLNNINEIEEAEVLNQSLSKNQLLCNENQEPLKQSPSKYKMKPKHAFKEKNDRFSMKVREKQSFIDSKNDLSSKRAKIITINKTNNKEYNKQQCETAPNIDQCNYNDLHKESIIINLNKNKYYKHFNNDFTDIKSLEFN